ncbi:hypothetical protein QFC22_001481 [Naganishia vaughanmartiniae]|uniref:Uncharacterized protein n=1 Tax=Naganishia vaughanmartiniae TaxID=1424756 RepID=A0ACC2XHI2_9TREE|nr:hypothetical protein QFC22_001481 [Naganishia vaughanmartiniae]
MVQVSVVDPSGASAFRKCEVHQLEVRDDPSMVRNDSQKDAKGLVTIPPPAENVSSSSPTDVEVTTVDFCPVVPKQTETSSGDMGARLQPSKDRHAGQKKPTSVMYIIPIQAHHKAHRTAEHSCEAAGQSGQDMRSRNPILRSHSTPAADRPERNVNVKGSRPTSAKVSFARTKDSSQSAEMLSEGKAPIATIKDKVRTVAQDRTHASMQLLMRYAKELEGKRLRNERLRQKNSLHFGYQALRWMAISHSVIFVCASVIVLALVKG